MHTPLSLSRALALTLSQQQRQRQQTASCRICRTQHGELAATAANMLPSVSDSSSSSSSLPVFLSVSVITVAVAVAVAVAVSRCCSFSYSDSDCGPWAKERSEIFVEIRKIVNEIACRAQLSTTINQKHALRVCPQWEKQWKKYFHLHFVFGQCVSLKNSLRSSRLFSFHRLRSSDIIGTKSIR